MDRRLLALGLFSVALVVIVGVVLIARAGDDPDDGSTTAEAASKPEVAVPEGPPPSELQIEDLEEGEGDAAQAGDRVSVHYVGVDFSSGDEFDSSYERGQPLQLEIGGGQVIPGWEQGLEGMKVGGRRQLVIPPELAYGPEGQPPDIAPNATLVFVIDLVSIDS